MTSQPPSAPAGKKPPAAAKTGAAATPASGKGPFRGAFVVLALIALLGTGFLAARHYFGQPMAGSVEPAAVAGSIGGPFTLVDQNGNTVTDATFLGRYMLVYFGFTYCPDICPTSLVRNSNALDLLGDKADKVVPILISVDAERDTPEKMQAYVKAFGPRLVGLTGTEQQIAAAAEVYRVFYVKIPAAADAPPDSYLVDHSAFTYLMGPDGKFLRFFRHSMSPDEMAQELRQVIR
jgi:protein SCO1/2